jgi:hypothetical protein
MMDEFTERKKAREGRVTAKATIEDLYEALKRGLVEHVVFVVRQPDGEIKVGYSDAKHTELIGMLEVGKFEIITDMM